MGDRLDRTGLTAKQRFVVECRLGLRSGRRMTFQEIGDSMGIKKQSAHELWTAANRNLTTTLTFDS